MSLKEQLLEKGYNNIDIMVIDEDNNQSTIPDLTLHKINNLEYKLYLDPESVKMNLDEEHPHFTARQKSEDGGDVRIKGFILEW
ncbi:hypothetical protein SAMN05421743_12231 [Thalassobacillus cyri]|uniref:Uncharacterized protein n=1 Tax=Thalassobacillus cyri TaxID=571932 RepID=A0A1H4H4H7_9BACI|nr:hypothetical protein [Thalassobacillus cyri]SEB16531.1 hypothetical protein SAMN05421743_12231 [Thalassobacillus cyri]